MLNSQCKNSGNFENLGLYTKTEKSQCCPYNNSRFCIYLLLVLYHTQSRSIVIVLSVYHSVNVSYVVSQQALLHNKQVN